jgi:hypothetical protein
MERGRPIPLGLASPVYLSRDFREAPPTGMTKAWTHGRILGAEQTVAAAAVPDVVVTVADVFA